MNDAVLKDIATVGRDVLENIPHVPGACAPMSAAFVCRWEMEDRPRAFAVAGELYVGDDRIFGSETIADTIQRDIDGSNPSWDGHFWVVIGSLIVDLSIFRTAYSDGGSPVLKSFVHEQFGAGRGLLVADNQMLESDIGLRYSPHAVLTEEQVSAYFAGIRVLLDRHNG